MIVVWTAELAQSYIAHARSSRRPSPRRSRRRVIDQRSGATGAIASEGARIHARSMSHTALSWGSQAGRLCHPVPPGNLEDMITPRVAGSFCSSPLLNDARHVIPSIGTLTNTARQRPRETIPGRLDREGVTPSGSTKAAFSPGARGTTVIVNSVPAATGFSVNSLMDPGVGPGDGAVVRNT